MSKCGKPNENTTQIQVMHHSDQGVQYTCTDYVDLLRQHRVALGKPEENGHAERMTDTPKEVEVDLSEYRDF